MPLRSKSCPKNYQVKATGQQQEAQSRKHKSLTFKERLRSTFRSYHKKTTKISEEVIYGKVVVFGDQGVGKTSIIHRLANNYFTTQYNPTSSTAMFDVSAMVEVETCAIKKLDLQENHSITKAAMVKRHSKGYIQKEKNTVERVLNVKTQDENKKDKEVMKKSHKNTSIKQFKFQLVDDVYNVNISAPATYRALLSDAHGFILTCSYDRPESITYLQTLYDDIKSLSGDLHVPVIVVLNKADIKSDNSTDIEEKLNTFCNKNNLLSATISTSNMDGFEKLTELMLKELNSFEEEEEKEHNLDDYYAFIEEKKRHPEPFSQWKVMM